MTLYKHCIPKKTSIVIVGLLAASIAACGSGDDPRYRSTELLERPPVLPTNKLAGDVATVSDDAVIPKKRQQKGLGDGVYVTKTRPMQIRIKQPFENGWSMLGLALKQSEIKITDQDRSKGLYYVAYQPGNLAGMLGTLLNVEQNPDVYLLKVTAEGDETAIVVTPAGAAEQQDGSALSTDREGDAEDLLYNVFETLRDDLEN